VVKRTADGVGGAIGRMFEAADKGSASPAYAAALLGQGLITEGSGLGHISTSSR